MRDHVIRFALISLGVVALAGCRFKGAEGFISATTPVEYKVGKGDPYASGGIAGATGGTNVTTNYGKGARNVSTGKLDPKLDQPAKGVGQEPGENPVTAGSGYGNSNAPAHQIDPANAATRY